MGVGVGGGQGAKYTDALGDLIKILPCSVNKNNIWSKYNIQFPKLSIHIFFTLFCKKYLFDMEKLLNLSQALPIFKHQY